jgi:hypothetical protein
MLHDPWHMNIGRMTPAAQQLVIERLTNHKFHTRYRAEIERIVQFIRNGQGSDGRDFVNCMQLADQYRKQSFAETHPGIARAMGY